MNQPFLPQYNKRENFISVFLCQTNRRLREFFFPTVFSPFVVLLLAKTSLDENILIITQSNYIISWSMLIEMVENNMH